MVLLHAFGPPLQKTSGSEMDRARKLIADGIPAQAATLLRDYISRNPQSGDAQLMLGVALSLVPLRSESMAAFKKAIEMQPRSATAHNTMGLALGRFGELQAARDSFENSLTLDPRYAEAHINLALVLAQLNQRDTALQHLASAATLLGHVRSAAYPLYLRAKIYNEQGLPDQAAAELKKALELRPDYAEAHLDLGLTLIRQSDLARAGASLERAVQLAPNNATARLELGRYYLNNGQQKRAVEQLAIANQLRPNHRPTMYSLARGYRAIGRQAQAQELEEQLRRLLQLSTQASESALESTRLNNEGVGLEQSGHLQAAADKYRAALDLDPLNSGFRRNLALVLCRLGLWKDGVAELREVLRLDPNDADATKALYIALEKI